MSDENTTSAADAAGDDEGLKIWNELLAKEEGRDPADGQDASETVSDQKDQEEAEPAAQAEDNPNPDHDAEKASDKDAKVKADDKDEPAKGGDDDTKQTNELERLRAENEQLRKAQEKNQHELVSNRGRVAALTRKIEIERKGRAGLKDSPTNQRINEEFPELAASQEAQRKREEEASKEREAIHQNELADIRQQQTQVLLRDHPDAETLLAEKQAEFSRFLQDPNTPRRVLEAYSTNAEGMYDGKAASQLFTDFKQFLEKGKVVSQDEKQPAKAANDPAQDPEKKTLSDKKREQQLTASAGATGTRQTTTSGIPENADPEAIWDHLVKVEQDRERRRG